MNPSPDTVVTLTSAALLGSVSFRAHDIRSTRHSGIDKRTWGALDALAALCVCEPSSDVIAIGCRYQTPNTELIIASKNGPPSEKTLKHLNNVWELLSSILGRKYFGETLSTDPAVDSP